MTIVNKATENKKPVLQEDAKLAAQTAPPKIAKVLPQHINLDKWEDADYIWTGTIAPQEMTRLLGAVPEAYQDEPIGLTCELSKQGQLLTLAMTFDGEVWVTCQRCLQPLAIELSHQAQLILLQTQAQESLVDEADDYVLLEELLGEQSENSKGERLLPIKKLVEDELLLHIPLAAKHDDCAMAVEQVGIIIEEEKPSPFAALQVLKGKL